MKPRSFATRWCAVLLVLGTWGCGTNHDDNPKSTDINVSGADIRTGALLWDRWWAVNGSAEPADTFPLYTKTNGTQTGSTTWRCQECHGWDYRGSAGEYATGPHFTGVAGLIDRIPARTNEELIGAIAFGTPPPSGGSALTGGDHSFNSELNPSDVADIVHFLRDGLVDTTAIITADGQATGNATAGKPLYAASSSVPTVKVGQCALCHGDDGKAIDLGAPGAAAYVGTLAESAPWQTLHEVRWGLPGSSMPSAVHSGISLDGQRDLLAYIQTLPEH